MNTMPNRLVTEAMKWPPLIGPAPKGVHHLLKMYQETAPNLFPSARAPWPTPVRDAIRRALEKGMWINRAAKSLQDVGTYDSKKGIHWCGIFATWMLKRAGLQATWTTNGLTASASKISKISVSTPGARQGISAGDICVHGSNQHHFIVIGEVGSRKLLTVEGNVRNQEVLRREKNRDDPLLHTVYKLR